LKLTRIIVLSFAILFAAVSFGAEPLCTIDFVRVTDSLGVVSGRAGGNAPVYITVDNGGLKYTTLADPDGNWTTTFRYFGTQVRAECWKSGASSSLAPATYEIQTKDAL